MPSKFEIPENFSCSWEWKGTWYAMTYKDCHRLDSLSNDPKGPTHAEKIDLMHRNGWETCTAPNGFIHCRAPS